MHSVQSFTMYWNDHHSMMVTIFKNLLESGTLVDCTIAAEGQYLKVHKMVLSSCSPIFQLLLSEEIENHPVIILHDVKFQELKSMIDFMYRGEVQISNEQLADFLDAAKSLQIKGLGDCNPRDTEPAEDSSTEMIYGKDKVYDEWKGIKDDDAAGEQSGLQGKDNIQFYSPECVKTDHGSDEGTRPHVDVIPVPADVPYFKTEPAEESSTKMIDGECKEDDEWEGNTDADAAGKHPSLQGTDASWLQPDDIQLYSPEWVKTDHRSDGGSMPLLDVIPVPGDVPGVKTEPEEVQSMEMIDGEDKVFDEWEANKDDYAAGEHSGLQGTDNIQVGLPECIKKDDGSDAETRPLLDVIPVPADVPDVKAESAEDPRIEMIEGEDMEEDEREGNKDDDAAGEHSTLLGADSSCWQPEDDIQLPECVEEDPALLMDMGRDRFSTAPAFPEDDTVRRCSEVSINHVISHTSNGKEISINRTNHLQTDTAKKSSDVFKTLFSADSFHKRIENKEIQDEPHYCDVCNKTFATNSLLSIHMTTHTAEKPYCCAICKKTFARRDELSIHMRTHTGEKPYCCDICNKTFVQSGHLSQHMRTHTGEKPYCCDICKKTFSRSSAFSRHMRTHTGEKPYCCDICQKTFGRSGHLSHHMRTHTGEKPYCCEICKKTFAHSTSFSNHMRTHTGDKPYCCDICNMTFVQSGHLSHHMRTHTGEKPYCCDICQKTFGQSGNLSSHMRTHTGEKPYSCDICKRTFAHRSSLSIHFRTHTGEKL